MKARSGELHLAVDLGSSKVCALIGRRKTSGVDLVGIGVRPSRGLRKGAVVDVEATSRAIREAVDEAELMAGSEVRRVTVGIGGPHVVGGPGHSVVAVGGEVTQAEVDEVIRSARSPVAASSRVLLHSIVQGFQVDHEVGIADPVGMAGRRLEVHAHLVSSPEAPVANVSRACIRAGLAVEAIVLGAYATGRAALDEGEREMGTVLVDVGHGTTDVAIWSRGTLVHNGCVALGGDNVTSDIGVAFRVPSPIAQSIKEHHGIALTDIVARDESFEVPATSGRKASRIPRRLLAAVIEPRLEEIFRFVRREVECSGYHDAVGSGYVLTGGSVMQPGVAELAERVLQRPVRIGVPGGVGGLVDLARYPKLASGVGTLLHAASEADPHERRAAAARGRGSTIVSRIRSFVGAIL